MKCLILLCLSFLFISCFDKQHNELITSPGNVTASGVKSKIYYPSTESNQILSIEDFFYSDGQLKKKIYYSENRVMISRYELFTYNDFGKLLYKLSYYNNINSPTGFILLDSTVYSYTGNLLSEERRIFPQSHDYIKYVYKYNGVFLIKKMEYTPEGTESYITYEYSRNLLCKETNYYKDNLAEYKEYKYRNGFIIEKVFYTSRDEPKRKIYYNYNKQGKFILEQVDEHFPYSSSLPYIIRYLY